MSKKVLTALLVGLVVCFIAQPITLQAKESDPVKAKFSLIEDYSAPLVIPTVVKLDPTVLRTVKAPEVQKSGVPPLAWVYLGVVAGVSFGCLAQK